MKKIIFILTLLNLIFTYKDIICLHGIASDTKDFDRIEEWVGEVHPGTRIIKLVFYENLKSYESLLKQIPFVISELRKVQKELNLDNYILLGHSQGALIGRAALMEMDDHKCETFISMSGPQMGQYGIPDTQFPDFLKKLTLPEISQLFYTKEFQHSISFANFWNYPMNQDVYLKKNMFLPLINNQTFNNKSENYKENILKLKKFVLFATTDDEVIMPWQSAIFGFFKEKSITEIVDMENQQVYIGDYFGLKSLKQQNKLFLNTISGGKHNSWIKEKDIFMNNVFPYLY